MSVIKSLGKVTQLEVKIMSQASRKQAAGINAALTSALFLGLSPVMGKMAILHGLPPLFVVALRTILAALLLLAVMAIFKRSYLFIYPAGLIGCIMAGWVNGVGSLLYYSALGRIDASLGQIIYSLYPLFVAIWLWFDRQPLSRMTVLRLVLVLPALLLLMQNGDHIDLIGVGMMLGSSILYALHLPINQRVLLDMPAPTVTLYTLLAMSATVMSVLFFVNFSTPPDVQGWSALGTLTLITFGSRLTLFLGVKHLGGVQTALLGLGELLVTIFFSYVLLGERLSVLQWMGVIILVISLILVRFDKPPAKKSRPGGILSWLTPPSSVASNIPWQPHE